MGGTRSPQLYRGRVEVRRELDADWGTVCDDLFDDIDATVICRMFGYPNGIARRQAHFGPGTGRIHMDDLRCRGNESSVFDCPYKIWNRHNCGHAEDAGVECSHESGR